VRLVFHNQHGEWPALLAWEAAAGSSGGQLVGTARGDQTDGRTIKVAFQRLASDAAVEAAVNCGVGVAWPSPPQPPAWLSMTPSTMSQHTAFFVGSAWGDRHTAFRLRFGSESGEVEGEGVNANGAFTVDGTWPGGADACWPTAENAAETGAAAAGPTKTSRRT
jgi:hypothetical protein